MATIFFPTGLYAFKRINKLRYGILIYLGSFVLLFLLAIGFVLNIPNINTDEFSTSQEVYYMLLDQLGWISLGWQLINITIPMYFIAKWTKLWNESIDRQNAVL